MKNIQPLKNIQATIRVPGSKSYTQRALIAASLANGHSFISGALISEDTGHLIHALRQVGINIHRKVCDLDVEGTGGVLTAPKDPIYMGNNGTGIRLLTGAVCLGQGVFVLDGNDRMRERPIQPLVDALNSMGVYAVCVNEDGCPPVRIQTQGLSGGNIALAGGLSSQYLSSLLLAAPYASRDTHIHIMGSLPSKPYVKMTIDVMTRFGVDVHQGDDKSFSVPALQTYEPRDYPVEGDASSATYFMAAAAICGGTVRISNLNVHSSQGDLRFVDILKTMGCVVSQMGGGLEITGPLSNHGDLAFDLADVPDMVPALAVVSAFRKGRTVLKNIAHLRVKESDRIAALTSELRKTGVHVDERHDEMTVQGMPTVGAIIECYNDHRIAMSFAVAGLGIKGIVINDPDCVKKSFPDFWEKLKALG
jgi:3-phosphoshikimate 1-carboxyvinyltransferase